MGLLLTFALAAAVIARQIRVPGVTAFLLVGLLLGPQAFQIIGERDLHILDPVGKLAMGLVLFNLGGHFSLVQLRRILKRVLPLSGSEVLCTFLLVSAGLMMLGESWIVAVLLGVMALATAPATTILVLKENRSEGPVTEYASALVVLNNLAAVLLFEVLIVVVQLASGGVHLPLHQEIGVRVLSLLTAVVIGGGAGLCVSYACAMLRPSRWLVLLTGVATLLLGLSNVFHAPYLLIFLTFGLTLATVSDKAKEILGSIDGVAGVLCVVFFVIHGAELNFKQLLVSGDWLLVCVAGAYIVLRSLGKYGGVYLMAHLRKESSDVRNWLGASILAQAGAAIALAAIVADEATGLGDIGQRIQLVIVSTVVVFELAGPLLIRLAVVRAGEVPLSNVIYHHTASPMGELKRMAYRMIRQLGIPQFGARQSSAMVAEQVMRRAAPALQTDADFDEVLSFIEHSYDNLYPVINASRELVGVIRYLELANAVFDPDASQLVCADDLAAPPVSIDVKTPVEEVCRSFLTTTDDCLPVTTGGIFAGLIRRRDILPAFARLEASAGASRKPS